MPELPDIEVYRDGLRRCVVGQPLERIRIINLYPPGAAARESPCYGKADNVAYKPLANADDLRPTRLMGDCPGWHVFNENAGCLKTGRCGRIKKRCLLQIVRNTATSIHLGSGVDWYADPGLGHWLVCDFPEPTPITLLGIGGLVLLRRRR